VSYEQGTPVTDQEVMLEYSQVLGSFVCPTVGAYWLLVT
jgi:hypothetical protein